MTLLDKKTGRAEPWAALQLAAYSLLDAPVEFTEDGHIYTFEGVVLPSVTQILEAEGAVDTTFYDEYSRHRGSMVHLATHLDDTGELDEDSVDPVIRPYLEAWRRFKRESGFTVEYSEVPMMSTAYRYAGTPDVLGRFPENNGPARAVVELHEDGKYKLVPFTDRRDTNIWLSCLAYHNWKANNLRGKKQ